MSRYVGAAYPRFAPDDELVVDAHNGEEHWTGAEWNEYVTDAERCQQEVTARLIRCPQHRPAIVVLCGSTRFYDEFQRANYELTMAGRIVLSVGFYPHNPQVHGEAVGCTPEQKVELDELHKRKIDLADQVLVLNVSGYIGESTRSEIDYAVQRRKPVRYLEAGSTPALPPARNLGAELVDRGDGWHVSPELIRDACCAEFARTGSAHTEPCCYLGEDV